jgi:hypothetical protein
MSQKGQSRRFVASYFRSAPKQTFAVSDGMSQTGQQATVGSTIRSPRRREAAVIVALKAEHLRS